MKKLLSIIAILGLLIQIQAQNPEILGHFAAAELNGKVLLNWQIVKGQTCNGIQIYRSVNNSNFVQIGEIVGVCGSSLEAINYNFTDNNPIKNQENLYRLDLGGYGNSEILRKEVLDVQSEGFQIRPHPVVATSKLYFYNSKNKTHTLTVYNITGQEVLRTETTENYFNLISSSSFQSGVYFFRINDESNQVLTSGKVIFQ